MDRFFIETKVLGDSAGLITAVAWKFNTPDRVEDVITPDAFKAIKLPMPMLFGHDGNDPVGVWETAEVKSDGLYLTGRLLVDDLPRAREVLALVKSGAVRGISTGFLIKKAVKRSDGGRDISSLELLEASLVTIPMHPGARVISAKSAVEALNLVAAINRATAQLSNKV